MLFIIVEEKELIMFLLNKKYFMLGYVTEICYVPVGKIK